MMLGCRTRRSTATSFSIKCSCSHTPHGLSESHPCHSSPQKWRKIPAHLPAAASLVDDLQRVLLPRGPASQTSLSNVSDAKKTRFSDSSHAPHLSTHSLTTAKFPSPMTLPIWYFSLMRGEEMERLPFTAGRREDGSKLSKIQELFLNILRVFMPHAEEQSAPSASSACSAAPLRSVEEAPRGVYEDKGLNVKPCQLFQKCLPVFCNDLEVVTTPPGRGGAGPG